MKAIGVVLAFCFMSIAAASAGLPDPVIGTAMAQQCPNGQCPK